MSLWAFRFLLWYICIMMVQPQNRFQFLYPMHIADISIMAAVGLHCASALQEGRTLIRFGPATITALLLMLASLVSQYVGPMQISSSWNDWMDIIFKNSLVLILVEAMATTVQRAWGVQAAMLIASLWWVKAGLRLSFAGATYSGDRIMGGAVSLIENPNGFAYMMCVLIPTYLYFYQQSTAKYHRLAFLVLSFAGVFIVFQTGSRTGMVTLIVLSLFLLPKYVVKHRVALIITCVAVALIWSLVSGGNVQRFRSIPQSIKSFLSGEVREAEELSQDDQSAQERRLKNRDTWALIRAYPVFGVGINPDESQIAAHFPYATGQVHNELLMTGRMMGFVGMSLYAAVLIVLFRTGLRIQKYASGWWPAMSDLGWTFKLQAIVFAVGGFFSPIPFNAPEMFLVGTVSALWANLRAWSPGEAGVGEELAASVPSPVEAH